MRRCVLDLCAKGVEAFSSQNSPIKLSKTKSPQKFRVCVKVQIFILTL